MSERLNDTDAARAMSIGRANAWGRDLRVAAIEDWKRARQSEAEKDEVLTLARHLLETYAAQAATTHVVMLTADGVAMLQRLITRIREVAP